MCNQGLELGQWSVGSGLQLVMGARRYAKVAQARCYWSFLLLDQNLQKMGVFLTLHHEDMCVLDVYVQSKRLRRCLGCSVGEGSCWHRVLCLAFCLGRQVLFFEMVSLWKFWPISQHIQKISAKFTFLCTYILDEISSIKTLACASDIVSY